MYMTTTNFVLITVLKNYVLFQNMMKKPKTVENQVVARVSYFRCYILKILQILYFLF